MVTWFFITLESGRRSGRRVTVPLLYDAEDRLVSVFCGFREKEVLCYDENFSGKSLMREVIGNIAISARIGEVAALHKTAGE